MRWDVSTTNEIERAYLRSILPASHLLFSKAFFPVLEGSAFKQGRHHSVICGAIDKVFAGKILRLIVTLPPGYTKSLLVVIMMVAHGLAINPRARFLATSYSDKLVNDHSQRIRQIVESEHFQSLWPMALAEDTKAKGLWRTQQEGGLAVAPAGGTITGFRAGRMEEGFNGALIIDDPLKPDDAYYDTKREFINNRYRNTFASRLATERTPVIVIMQRIHLRDFAGHLLGGGSGERWTHLDLPVVLDRAASYPDENTYGDLYEHNLEDGPLWEEKHNKQQIEILRTDPYVFNSQYMQRPTAIGGNIFKGDWIGRFSWDDLPVMEYRKIYADTAQKMKEKNDFSVFEEWGFAAGKIYLLNLSRGRMEAPDLKKAAIAFWKLASARDRSKFGALREMGVEDKSSGTGLIQDLQRPVQEIEGGPFFSIPIQPIPRQKDKLTRAMDVAGYFSSGCVNIPEDAPWATEYLSELLAFPGGAFDDQVDPTMDAALDMLVNVSFVGVA